MTTFLLVPPEEMKKKRRPFLVDDAFDSVLVICRGDGRRLLCCYDDDDAGDRVIVYLCDASGKHDFGPRFTKRRSSLAHATERDKRIAKKVRVHKTPPARR